MVVCEKLTKAGIDVDSLLKRLMGNDSLIKVFIKKFVDDNTFCELKAAFDEKDMKKAEVKSHTLKGMCGNLSLDELYNFFTEQTNLIRCGDYEKAEGMMPEISKNFAQSIGFMKEFLEEN